MIKVWTDEDHLGHLRDEGVPYAVECSLRMFLKKNLCGRTTFANEVALKAVLDTWGAFVASDHHQHLRRDHYRERVANYWLVSPLMVTQADEIALYVRRRYRDDAGVIVVAEVDGLTEHCSTRVPPLQRVLPFARTA